MKFPAFEKTHMLTPAPKERLTARPVVVLLLFLLVMSLSQIGRTLFSAGATLLIPDSMTRNTQLLISLFATLATVGAVLVYCLAIERRSMASLGFVKRGAIAEYAVGLLGGLLLFGSAVLLCAVMGTLSVFPAEANPSWWLILLFFMGFLIQGMSEEMLCRSYLMLSLARQCPLWACAGINALLFSLLHLGNPGVSVIALINIFLFGLFASLLTLRRGSVWMVGALHSMWNFAQGNLFGIPVSGITGIPAPLRAEVAEGTWQALINGGSFGLEGGLAVTAALLLACGVVVILPTKKSEIARD